MDSLRPRYRGGRPRRITTEQRQRIVAVAGARPDAQGVPLTRWSLPRLADPPRRRGDRDLARATSAACSTRPGCRSSAPAPGRPAPTPTTRPRRRAILALCETRRPATGCVISFDQMGPVSLRPTAGAGWAPKRTARAAAGRLQPPRTAPATCSAPTTSTPTGSGSGCARGAPAATARLHAPDPRSPTPRRQRIYWIQDNLSANWTPDDPRLRRRQQDRARPDPDLRQLPQPGRVPLLRDHRVRRQQRRLPRLGRLRLRARPPRPHRNSDHRDRRIAAAEARHRIAA